MAATREELEELAALLEEKVARQAANRYKTMYSMLYPWQVEFVASTNNYSQCCLVAANRIGKCATVSSRVELPDGSVMTFGELYERGQPFAVNTWAGRVVEALAVTPIKKPSEPCVRLWMSDGRWVEVALRHRMLLEDGSYAFCEQLLPALPRLQLSSSEPSQLTHGEDARRSSGRLRGFLAGCLAGLRFCDEQLRTASNSARSWLRQQAGAQPHGSPLYASDACLSTHTNSRQSESGRLSSQYVYPPLVGRFAAWLDRVVYKAYQRTSGCIQAAQRLAIGVAVQPLSNAASGHGQQKFSLLSPHGNDGNQIIAYESIGSHEVYDFTVPETSNYIAGGVVHHNTWTGTYIDAIHALGEYPDGWPGHKFEHAPLIWCLGYSGEKTRDLLQMALVGRKNGDTFTGGIIPADRVLGYESMTGTPNAVRTLLIKHVSGETARIQFWSYSQGQHALMGDAVDWFHIDEEPRDSTIFPQVLVRTASGDRSKGGRGILTFTPENGRTELVMQFMDNPGRAQFCMQKGWDDAPHLNEKTKEDLLTSFPAHQREMRTKGVPMLGHGRIYDIPEEDVTCRPFDIPAHFKVINGMDFGFDHPQAQLQLCHDLDNGIFYVTKAWKKQRISPIEAWGATKTWSAGVPTAWPADGLQTEKGSGKQQKAYYVEAGFKLIGVHATWPDGSNGVEAGLFEIRDLMLKGKFKIFAGLRDLFDEFLQYHRDDHERIVKTRDDLLDAMRYAYMMRRFAVSYGDIGRVKRIEAPIPMVSPFARR